MRRLLFLLLLSEVSTASDPCNNCPLPGAFSEPEGSLCQNVLSDDTYTPTSIRYPLGNECYLQLVDCPAYDVISDSECAGMLSPQQALLCVNGTFRIPDMVMGWSIDKIRCNPDAYVVPVETRPGLFHCDYPERTPPTDGISICGPTTPDEVQVHIASEGNHINYELANCEIYYLIAGYDGIGSCRIEEHVTATCENGLFKLPDGQFIYKMYCGKKNTTIAGQCEKSPWMYNFLTDSYFKVGFNKTYDEAKATCIADGGQLASIHSREDNDFIVALVRMKNEVAMFGDHINVWIGIEPDGAGGFRNIDGTPLEFTYWRNLNPEGNGTCVTLHSDAGQWDNFDCSTPIRGYACRKTQLSKCTACPNIEQTFLGNDANLTVWYGNDVSTGCAFVALECSSTIPDQRVQVITGDRMFHSVETPCNHLLLDNSYVCNNEGKWMLSQNNASQPPAAICLHYGPCEESLCTSCPPITQKPTEIVGASNGILSATYDSSTGCMNASLTCTGTSPGQNMALTSIEQDIAFNEGCNAINFTNAYTCGSNGVWIGIYGQEVLPQVECAEIPNSNC